MRISKQTAALFFPVLFFMAYHFFNLPEHHTYDALYSAQVLQSPTIENALHPHHPLPYPAMLAWDRLFRKLGYHGNYFLPAQVLSLVFMTLCMLLFLKLMLRAIPDKPIVFLSFAGLMFSYGTWFIATEIESYAYTAFFVFAAIYALFIWSPRSPLQTFFIGVLIGVAACFHETSFLIFFPAALYILQEKNLKRTDKSRDLLLIGSGVFLFGLLPYLIINFIVRGLTLSQSIHWLFIYSSMLPGFGKFQFHLSPLGFFESLFGTYATDTIRLSDAPNAIQLILLLSPGIFILIFIAYLIITADKTLLSQDSQRAQKLFLCCFAILFIFWAAWDPVNYEAFQAVLPFFWGLIGLFVYQTRETLRRNVSSALLLILVITLFLLNHCINIPPKKSILNDRDYTNAESIANVSLPNDLLIIYDGNIEHYLTHHFKRPLHTTIHNTSIESKLDPAAALIRLKNKIDGTLDAGHSVIIVEEAITPSSGILDMHKISIEDLTRFWNQYAGRLTEIGSYPNLSMNRFFGMRHGLKSYRIYRLSKYPPVLNR